MMQSTTFIHIRKWLASLLVVVTFFLSTSIKLLGQDIHFSQFYLSPLVQNPALAGAESSLESTINYRTQWKSVTVPYKTYAAGIHGRFVKRKSQKNFFAAGANLFYDEAGDGSLKTTSINISLAYHIRLDRTNKLGLGFMSGYGQRRIDMGNFEWGSQYNNGYNSSLPTGEVLTSPTFSYVDFASGLVWSFDNNAGRTRVDRNNYMRGSAGISVFHFNQPAYSFDNTGDKLLTKYVAHGNCLLSLPGSYFALNPGFFYYKQGPSQQLFIGTMIRYDVAQASKYTGNLKGAGAYLGVYLRAKDALVISSMFELSDFTIGLSYDANLSNLRPASSGRGGFELSIKYTAASNFFGRTVQTL
jgi:type IX secretion system PorP/SprF family membrane protein